VVDDGIADTALTIQPDHKVILQYSNNTIIIIIIIVTQKIFKLIIIVEKKFNASKKNLKRDGLIASSANCAVSIFFLIIIFLYNEI